MSSIKMTSSAAPDRSGNWSSLPRIESVRLCYTVTSLKRLPQLTTNSRDNSNKNHVLTVNSLSSLFTGHLEHSAVSLWSVPAEIWFSSNKVQATLYKNNEIILKQGRGRLGVYLSQPVTWTV
jgi:hypothetical protein